MSAQTLALAFFDGIAYAALVFLVAVGLTLIFGVMRILNVAHGSLYAFGAYASVSLVTGLGLIELVAVARLSGADRRCGACRRLQLLLV